MTEPARHGCTPRAARMYGYLLGQRDYSTPDRDLAEELLADAPGIRDAVRVNRAFMLKAVSWFMNHDIAQVVDAGCGLPAEPMVHQQARAIQGGTRVVYADIDPVVVRRCRDHESIRGTPGVAVIQADAGDPAGLLGDPAVKELIRPAEPCGLLLGGTLSAMDASTARAAMAGFAAALAPGSAVAVTCVSYRDRDLSARAAERFTAATGAEWRDHDAAAVGSFFEAAGLRLLLGQVGLVRNWPVLGGTDREDVSVLGGIGVVR